MWISVHQSKQFLEGLNNRGNCQNNQTITELLRGRETTQVFLGGARFLIAQKKTLCTKIKEL